jgi:hypothetical protein
MVALGMKAPFIWEIWNLERVVFFADLKEKGTLILFICNHCPFVLHVIEEVVMISNDYKVQGLGVVAISSNAWIIRRMRRNSWRNLLSKIILNLYDETQEVAKAYHAACTPDFFYMTAKTN